MLIRHRGMGPQVDPTAYVAPTATLVGDVRVGPHARVLFGAVLDAEGSSVEVGAYSIVSEHAVLRATAVTDAPVALTDHVFVGPHATVLGAQIASCAYLAAQATVLQQAVVGAGACVAVGALVHARAVVPDELFVPPHTTAVGDPVELFGSGRTSWRRPSRAWASPTPRSGCAPTGRTASPATGRWRRSGRPSTPRTPTTK